DDSQVGRLAGERQVLIALTTTAALAIGQEGIADGQIRQLCPVRGPGDGRGAVEGVEVAADVHGRVDRPRGGIPRRPAGNRQTDVGGRSGAGVVGGGEWGGRPGLAIACAPQDGPLRAGDGGEERGDLRDRRDGGGRPGRGGRDQQRQVLPGQGPPEGDGVGGA